MYIGTGTVNIEEENGTKDRHQHDLNINLPNLLDKLWSDLFVGVKRKKELLESISVHT